ncbi:MAG: hypothetical protein ACRDP6_08410, partial [Actinoallomurus sp.]
MISGVEEVVRYAYRLRPGAEAKRALESEWHRCRFLWNETVHQQRAGSKPTFCTLSKMLTAARSSNAWLREGSQVAQQQTLRTYARRVVAENQTIAVEDFEPRFLARSSMARKAADAAIGAAKRELIERGMRAGRK